MDSEKEELEQLIKDWNESRLDIFAISEPDDNFDFYGVMRFYFQEPGAKDRKVATKCIRVNSSDTTEDVMKVLISKFHPDLKMLTVPNYSLYEVHETGTVCKLEPDQKPLYVQLYWQQSDRDGRFLLKSEDEQMTTQSLFEEQSDVNPQFVKNEKRLSRRERKELKKQRREQARKGAGETKDNIAKELYGDKPTSGLTRSLSNPEVVMKIRRQQRLEDRLKQFKDEDRAGKGGGGPMRIFAESLKPETPYKTVLVSTDDTTDVVLKTALEKYEVPPEEMDLFCLTMVTIPPGNQSDPETSGVKERVVDDQDCPLAIASSWPENKGELRFYLKKKDNMPKRKRGPHKKRPDLSPVHSPSHHTPPHPSGSPTITHKKETSFDRKETTIDGKESSLPEKEPISSPPVHIVDSAYDLPATLEFRESGEDAFFAVVISEVNGPAVHFKLAPTYTLYMCCRYRLSPKFRPDFSPPKRREKVSMTAKKVANMMWQTVKENNTSAAYLVFWMANSSEFLHFLIKDKHLSSMTEESQKILAHTTQQAFRSLVQCVKAELQMCLPAFLDPDESNSEDGSNDGSEDRFDPNDGYKSTERSFHVKHYGPHGQPLAGDHWMGKRRKTSRPALSDVLHTLTSVMSFLQKCRVNPALTIQLFSQVFHYINMWLFNRLVLEPQLKLCTRSWGVKLLTRLAKVQEWAQDHGLELAAECHLGRVMQAAFLLQVPKQDSTVISSHCYKLNSLQLRQLLEFYQPERDEPPISQDLIEKAVNIAENTADSVARSEGEEVLLEEEPDLHLPFLLPEDGYSSETTRGIPPGLKEFLEPLIAPGLCRLNIQPRATGFWTVYFKAGQGPDSPPPEPSPKELTKIAINKGSKGMGVSIVAAKAVDQEHMGIYVKEIVEGGPAYLDGRLKAGDQILDVNGESLVGIQQEDAVKILVKAGAVVNMIVSKGAVWRDGLSALLAKPAIVTKVEPMLSPGGITEQLSPKPSPPRRVTEPPQPQSRNVESRVEPRGIESPTIEPGNIEPRSNEPRNIEPRNIEPRNIEPRNIEPRSNEPRSNEPPPRSPDNYSPHAQKKQPPIQPRAPPRYRPPQGPRSPQIVAEPSPPAESDQVKQLPPKPEPRPRRSAYDSQYNDWAGQVKNADRKPEQATVQAKAIVEYKLDEVPIGTGKYKAPAPYASQQEIQRRQQEIQGRKLEEQRREQEERDRIEREKQERDRIEREQREEQERKEREKINREEVARREREQQQRERIEREQQQRERMEREKQQREEEERKERDRIMREEMTRRERERKEREDRERIQREELERERIAKEEQERKNREDWEKRERERIHKEERERIQREEREAQQNEMEKRKMDERREFDEMSRRTRELEMMLEKERREKELRLQELERQLQEQRAQTERMEREYRERMRAEDRLEPRNTKPPPEYNPHVHYIPAKEKAQEIEEKREVMTRPLENISPNYPPNYGMRNPPAANISQDSYDMDASEVERQFQQRLAQEALTDETDGNFVTVIRVPVQSDSNWESRDGGKTRDLGPRREPVPGSESKPRVRVDMQRSEDERRRSEMQWKREQDYQQQQQRMIDGEAAYRQQPAGAPPAYPRQPEWETEEERRQREEREENERLREANANRLRNREIENPDEEDGRSYANGRTRRVKFASVRTEITQPSPETELSRAEVKFVHDGKVEASDDEEDFPHPPPALPQDDDAPPVPPPPEDDRYRPTLPPKPQYSNKNAGAPEYSTYRDNESIEQHHPRMTDEELRYATYPGRQHNNNRPVPKARGVRSNQSPSPDQAKLPFKDKMKVFNENTPPLKQTGSKWERQWVNGESS